MVVQDMLRVFIIRIACQSADRASTLIRPIISLIFDRLSESSSPSETDTYKVIILFNFRFFFVTECYNIYLLLRQLNNSF